MEAKTAHSRHGILAVMVESPRAKHFTRTRRKCSCQSKSKAPGSTERTFCEQFQSSSSFPYAVHHGSLALSVDAEVSRIGRKRKVQEGESIIKSTRVVKKPRAVNGVSVVVESEGKGLPRRSILSRRAKGY